MFRSSANQCNDLEDFTKRLQDVLHQGEAVRFLNFFLLSTCQHPDALLLFLRLALGRLHRVSFFVMAEFLEMSSLNSNVDAVTLEDEESNMVPLLLPSCCW